MMHSTKLIERHRTVASATPLQKLIFGLAANCSHSKQTTCPSAHCGFVLRSQFFLARFNAQLGCNSGDTVPSQQLQNKTWWHKLNWRRKPRCCRRTIKLALTSARSGFHGRMERQAHCMSPRSILCHFLVLYLQLLMI